MKRVAVFRHAANDGPGYFGTFLDSRDIPWQLVKLDAGEPVPTDARAFSGLGFMGEPMSVNDELPWIAPVMGLIRDAVQAQVPVIGHCLGGQLLAKALGGVVSRNPVVEIGWGRVNVMRTAESQRWLGEIKAFESFHWHNETFTIPPGATRLAHSGHCANQLFSLRKNIGMQCHVEITPALIATWCADWEETDNVIQTLAQHTPSVQTPAEMLDRIEEKITALPRVADQIYTRWITGLVQ